MADSKTVTPCSTEYFSARSRSPSMASQRDDDYEDDEPQNYLRAPNEGKRYLVGGVSKSTKRQFKDRKIYVNPRNGLPVRPPTSFALFKHTMRRSIKEGKVGFQEFNRKATEEWTKMSDEDKEPYIGRAKELAARFKRIEATCLRKRVRQLEQQVKSYRRARSHRG